MFGTNIPIKPRYDSGELLRVVSVFRTIQGEGPYAGMPAVFVRLAGCNLRCFFCDTDFESRVEEAAVEDLRDQIRSLASPNVGLVVLTGGEPLAQNCAPLIARLLEGSHRFRVQVETAGTVWQPALEALLLANPERVVLVCSPKTATVHPQVQRFCRHYKYIIREGELSPEDGLPVYSTQDCRRPLRLFRPAHESGAQIWVQPCDEYLSVGEIRSRDYFLNDANLRATVQTALAFGYRVSLQSHKILGVE